MSRFHGLTPQDWFWRGRCHVALYIRRFADMIGPDTTYRHTGLKMRMVKGTGIRVSWTGTGAPGADLWYREQDYEKVYDKDGEAFNG